MVERDDRRAALATFFVQGALSAGETIRLGDDAAHHARVRRLVSGQMVRLTNGAGTVAAAELMAVGRGELEVRLTDTELVPRSRSIHVRVPIADRDRMLWLAEKATELGIATWQPVRFRRSASVSPRGEGPAFAAKVRARMIGALEQSGGAWLPDQLREAELGDVHLPEGAIGLVLDQNGAPILQQLARKPRDVAIVLGPEGGMEPAELELLVASGWRSVRVAFTILRFETAALAAVAIARATTLTEEP